MKVLKIIAIGIIYAIASSLVEYAWHGQFVANVGSVTAAMTIAILYEFGLLSRNS